MKIGNVWDPASIVQKLWSYCSVLRDDGMSYGDYVGQPIGQHSFNS